MERNEIVKLFLGSGYQLAGDALSFFEKNPGKVQEFVSKISATGQKPTVTLKLVEEVLGIEGGDKEIKILRRFDQAPREMSIDKFALDLVGRYGKISEILMNRSNDLPGLISINRIPRDQSKFSLIAMIREVNRGDSSIVAEDLTGKIDAIAAGDALDDFKFLVEDEVVGLVFENSDSSENRFVKIVFPDVPFATTTSQLEMSAIFLSDIEMGAGTFEKRIPQLTEKVSQISGKKKLFVLGPASDEKIQILKDRLGADVEVVQDPVLYDAGGVKILTVYDRSFSNHVERFGSTPENALLQFVRKRFLVIGRGKIDLADNVPNVVVLGGCMVPGSTNYKGITLISLGAFGSDPVFWSVNLKTRETGKIELE